MHRLLAEFVQFIQRRKTVVLEELAAEFGLRTQVSTIQRGLRASL
jgi:predicted DNA-binding transcriptional regulator YafY